MNLWKLGLDGSTVEATYFTNSSRLTGLSAIAISSCCSSAAAPISVNSAVWAIATAGSKNATHAAAIGAVANRDLINFINDLLGK